MKKALYGLFMALGLMLGFTGGAINAQAQGVNSNNIKELPGYKSYGTLSSFTKHLRQDPVLYRALSSNQKLSEKIMGSTTLQRKLLGDIKKSGDSQSVVSSYVSEFSQTGDVTGNAFGQTDNGQTDSFTRQEEQRQKRRELNQQQISGDDDSKARRNSQRLDGFSGNANLAAQRAIEKAQREKEAADRHAKDVIANAQAQLDPQKEQKKFQSEMLRFKAVQDMISQIAHDPVALEAFWADTQMLQKLMDKEMTIQAAMAKLGVTPAPGTTAPAPEPTPHTTPDTSDDAIFGDGFEGGGNDGLVHVSGNHYKLNGMDVWDMNHIPDSSEQALDANGWPKYLGVPASCPPPRENTKYFHEAYYNYNGGQDPEHPWFGRFKHSVGDMSVRLSSYFNYGTWYYTSHDVGDPAEGKKSQETAYPFITPNRIGAHFGTKVTEANFAKPSEVQSVAYCPGDFTGVTPAGEVPLPEGCKGGVGYFGPKDVQPFIAHKGDTSFRYNCELEPGKKYFHNFRPLRDHKAIADGIDLTQEAAPGEFGENSGRTGAHSGTQKAFNAHRPPYANNCVNGQGKGDGAFPVNYSGAPSTPAGFSQPSDCGRRAPHNISGGSCKNHAYRSECYDVTGQLPPVTFQRECVGSEFVWSKGYGEKALSNYVCERFTPNGELYDGAPYHWGGVACAMHRVGEIRKEVAQLRVGASGYVVRNQYQCQFDEDLGRYDWHVVASTKPVNDRNVRHTVTRQVEPPNGAFTFPPPAHKNTCMWEGKEYPLGTEMVQELGGGTGGYNNKRLGTHKYVCMQRAPAPALPRFTHTEIYVSPETPPTVGSAYSVTFEKPTTYAPNCEGRQPAGMVAAETCLHNKSGVNCQSFRSVFGTEFPGGAEREFVQPNGKYTTLRFTTDNLKATRGTWVFMVPQFGLTRSTGQRILSISKCPGDFDRHRISQEMGKGCFKKTGFTGDLGWQRAGHSRGINDETCILPEGEDLWLNILYTVQPEDTPLSSLKWSCGPDGSGRSECSNLVQPTFQ